METIQLNLPIWRPDKLLEHYQKHCINERPCLDEVLRTVSLVTKDEYEIAAQKSFTDAYIQYDAVESNRQKGGNYPKRHYRIDGRSLKTITDLETSYPRYFRSCYHVHYGRKHRSKDLAKLPGDQILAYLAKLVADREQGMVSDCRIQCTNRLNGLAGKVANVIRTEVNRINKLM